MRTVDVIRLLALAAIWGGSFIFMRVLAPVLGPVVTADLRVLIAGIALLLFFMVIKFNPQWRRFWKEYLLIGAVNSAIPFYLFSFAALHIPASLSVILNSTAPLFGAIFSAIWLGERITIGKGFGFVLGITGVFLVAYKGSVNTDPMFVWAVSACIGATVCYGFVTTYIKRFCAEIAPMGIAGCSQFMAGVVLAPAILFSPVRGTITLTVAAGVLVFALLCSAVAYLLYYRLIADVGPTKTLTVTFLMPVFGMMWGSLFLHESISAAMIIGAAMVISGTGLVLLIRKPRPVVVSIAER
jgi:drug/metabolite transporter (DMT)-like permease